jgi:Na+/H+ antiporter NhaD/arsenite permease-like protein
MLLGAFIVRITGQISPIEALKSINFDVMPFLFGMFVVGSALKKVAIFIIYLVTFFEKQNLQINWFYLFYLDSV